MTEYTDSTDRTAAEYVLFALGFIGVWVAVVGVVVAAPAVAVAGGLLLLLAALGFRLVPSRSA